MAQIIDIIRVTVGCEYLTATVRVADGAPLMTSEDLEGTTRVYNLMPPIINHACAGDYGDTFRDCMGDTEICHLRRADQPHERRPEDHRRAHLA